MLKARSAQELLEDFTEATGSRAGVCLIGDPSDAMRPFAVHVDAMLAFAITACQALAPGSCSQTEISALQAAPDHPQAAACSIVVPPPTPLVAIAATEQLLQRVTGGYKCIHVLETLEDPWPPGYLKLMRACLAMHLVHVAQLPRSRLRLVSIGKPNFPKHLHQYFTSTLPAAFLTLNGSHTAAQLPKHLLASSPCYTADVFQCLAGQLDNAALIAGLCGIATASLHDVYSSKSGVWAPITHLSRAAAARDAVSEYLRACNELPEDVHERGGGGNGSEAGKDPTKGGGLRECTARGFTASPDQEAASGAPDSVTFDPVGVMRHALERCRVKLRSKGVGDEVVAAWALHSEVIAAGLPLQKRAFAVLVGDEKAWRQVSILADAISEELLPVLQEKLTWVQAALGALSSSYIVLGTGADSGHIVPDVKCVLFACTAVH
jgi:hypothetical protein